MIVKDVSAMYRLPGELYKLALFLNTFHISEKLSFFPVFYHLF